MQRVRLTCASEDEFEEIAVDGVPPSFLPRDDDLYSRSVRPRSIERHCLLIMRP
jgi:hypothetical protein